MISVELRGQCRAKPEATIIAKHKFTYSETLQIVLLYAVY